MSSVRSADSGVWSLISAALVESRGSCFRCVSENRVGTTSRWWSLLDCEKKCWLKQFLCGTRGWSSVVARNFARCQKRRKIVECTLKNSYCVLFNARSNKSSRHNTHDEKRAKLFSEKTSPTARVDIWCCCGFRNSSGISGNLRSYSRHSLGAFKNSAPPISFPRLD